MNKQTLLVTFMREFVLFLHYFWFTRAVGVKSGPSLAEYVHSDLATSAKLVSITCFQYYSLWANFFPLNYFVIETSCLPSHSDAFVFSYLTHF